jgi:hypothetical protein
MHVPKDCSGYTKDRSAARVFTKTTRPEPAGMLTLTLVACHAPLQAASSGASGNTGNCTRGRCFFLKRYPVVTGSPGQRGPAALRGGVPLPGDDKWSQAHVQIGASPMPGRPAWLHRSPPRSSASVAASAFPYSISLYRRWSLRLPRVGGTVAARNAFAWGEASWAS